MVDGTASPIRTATVRERTSPSSTSSCLKAPRLGGWGADASDHLPTLPYSLPESVRLREVS